MNLCDYYVEEVLSCPVFRGFDEDNIYWWEIEVSYYYDNGNLKTKKLTFDTEKEVNQVKKGFHFTA